MSDKVDLRLDWCSYDAAKYAVEHWHYSHCMLAGLLIKIGAWEDGQFIGRLVYESMAEKPQALYGESGVSNYQGQSLKLSKHFRAS